MRAGDFAAALNTADAAIANHSGDVDARYFRAVSLRYLKHFDKALAELAQLLALSTGNGRAYQEQGHCHKAQHNFQEAISAYQLAVQANPALLSSWQSLVDLWKNQGEHAAAEHAKRQLQHFRSLPKAILAAQDLVGQGKWLKAEKLCRQILKKQPKHIEGMRLLATIGEHLGAMDEAEFLLESARAFAPENSSVHMDYVQILRKRQKFSKALTEAEKLWQRQPDNPQFRSLYAIVCMQTGDYEQAIQHFESVLQRVPGDPVTLTSKGHALKTWGKTGLAIESYEKAIATRFNHGEAWYSLANLKTYSFTAEQTHQMNQLLKQQLLPQDAIYLHFALGKAWEDQSQFRESFHHYQAGNRLRKQQSRYRAETTTQETLEQRKVFSPELITRHQASGHPDPAPIFIVGLPRAGSTLLEQILASHSQVDGTLELPNILSLVHKLRRGPEFSGTNHYPSCIDALTAEQLREFGNAYINDTQIHRQGAPFFIDKMPNNFRHIGLIKLILPQAKIIDARRNPMACCFSGFKQLFAEGQEFTYSLEDLGHYYRDYVHLMDFWQQAFPGEILLMEYEQVVEDFEPQVRRLLDFCGLPFEESCLNFYDNNRAVRTASSEQVRQPIYRSGLEQWRNFDELLEPLKQALKSL